MHPGHTNADDTLDAEVLAPLDEIERSLERWINDAGAGGELAGSLRDAMAYAVLGGGKRLRPLLVWHSAEACGGRGEASLHAAAAVELVHAFSLVHDDLPAMDDDDLRRGRPTLHIHAGEAMAILAGDAILSLAYDTLARGSSDALTAVALVRELARGSAGMITGQVFDTMPDRDAETAPADPLDRIRRIHRNKTGALIRSACRMGAVCAGAPGAAVDAAGAFGDAIGLMFQAVDDLIDVEQASEHAGKRTGKDTDAGKLTYPATIGIDGTRREIDRLLAEARDHADRLPGDSSRLTRIAAYLAVRDR